MKNKFPVDAVVAVTYRCNSRCVMCNIWQIKDFPEMAPAEYARLPASLTEINISGGEPFLRRDLPEIIRVIKKACPKARLIVSSNGFLVEVIKEMLPRILEIDPKIGLNISIDGLGEVQERVRRVPKAWEKDVETLRFARKIGVKNLGVSFTLNNENAGQARRVYDFCQKNKLKFTMALAQSSEVYFGQAKNKLAAPEAVVRDEFQYLVKKHLNSFNPLAWARAYFINGLYDLAAGRKAPLKSPAGEDFFYLDPKGDVYPSVADNLVMGNIRESESFIALWNSEQAEKARSAIQGYESDYWFICTARSAMKRNPLKVAKWILGKKVVGV
jgi:MoaA/NifB/PqqE/SkfB family radical SAM enzyme